MQMWQLRGTRLTSSYAFSLFFHDNTSFTTILSQIIHEFNLYSERIFHIMVLQTNEKSIWNA